ncbi:hypothetical protein V6N11_065927 [Hibiscus sabdariffa]|uniref:Uncharacterized protein n=1 Tax=Hibiscus sabdariffa TaxID=183260 RepID=A0ABR2PJG3_9ROSI
MGERDGVLLKTLLFCAQKPTDREGRFKADWHTLNLETPEISDTLITMPPEVGVWLSAATTFTSSEEVAASISVSVVPMGNSRPIHVFCFDSDHPDRGWKQAPRIGSGWKLLTPPPDADMASLRLSRLHATPLSESESLITVVCLLSLYEGFNFTFQGELVKILKSLSSCGCQLASLGPWDMNGDSKVVWNALVYVTKRKDHMFANYQLMVIGKAS